MEGGIFELNDPKACKKPEAQASERGWCCQLVDVVMA